MHGRRTIGMIAAEMERSSLAGGVPEIVLPVCAAGVSAVALGLAGVMTASDSGGDALFGPLLLLALAVAAEQLPLPVVGGWKVSLGCVFLIAAGILYGVAIAVVIAALTIALGPDSIARRKPAIRLLYNISSITLATGAAAVAADLAGDREAILPAVVAAAAAFLAVNLVVVTAIVSRVLPVPFGALALSTLRGVSVPFALAVSVVPLFVLAWESSSVVALSAAIPLAGVGLHLRSLERSRQSLQLALTDPLTGLGNRRHFEERLRRELDRSDAGESVVSLVLIDLNRLKSVNDRFGHEAGDRLLCDVAACLRSGGESFRFGGDEFALLLAGTGEHDARGIMEAARSRIETIEIGDGLSSGAALGLATYPGGGVARDAMIRAADEAVYREKRSRTASS